MSYEHLTSIDSIDTMINRLKNFNRYLPLITGEYADGIYSNGFHWGKSSCYIYTIYTSDNCIVLDYQLKKLAESIEVILHSKRGNPEYAKLEAESKRILLATYNTILSPTYDNCNALHAIASEVSGTSNTWAKIGIVLGTIVGLILGILPGVIFADYHSYNNTWAKNSQQGLSLQADTIANAIKHTRAPARINEYSFFTPLSAQFATDAAKIAVAESFSTPS